MNESKYREVLKDYVEGVSSALQLSAKLEGRDVSSTTLQYAESCFKTMLCFASTVLHSVPFGDAIHKKPVWNLPAACGAARSIMEAYRSFSYIAVHDVDEEERTFRLQLLRLHDVDRRIAVSSRLGRYGTSKDELIARAIPLRESIQRDVRWKRFSKDRQKKILDGEGDAFVLTNSELDKASRIDTSMRMVAQIFLSQFTHTLPMAMHVMYRFEPGEGNAWQHMAMPLQHSLGYILRATDELASMFKLRIQHKADVKARFSVYLRLLENGSADSPLSSDGLTESEAGA